MARDLVALRALKIANCQRMEEIVEKEKGEKEAIDKITFPLLGNIILEDLPNLTSFNPGNHAFKCPSLKLMKIVGCLKMKTFTSAYEGFQETSEQGNLDIPSAPLFNKKVAFPNLEELVLKSVSLKKIWNYRLPIGSFWKLKSLKVDDCGHLLNIVPSHMLMRLQNLESLEVRSSSGSLECLFEFEGINNKERHILRATRLRYLYLYWLQSLVHIWKKDSLRYFPFQKLSSLQVYYCYNMRNIFTTSIAKSLVQLQELLICYCSKVEEIVEKDGEEEDARDKIVFPQMTSLSLSYLWQLKSFCQGIHISEWPSLKKLNINTCGNVEIIFSAELSRSLDETRGKGYVGTPTRKPLFLLGKIWKKDSQGIFPFQNLTSLEVRGCSNLRNIFTTSTAKSLVQLQQLIIDSCDKMEEIVEKKGEEEEKAMDDKIVFPQLTSLELKYLVQLKSFCQGIHISEWPSLKKLEMNCCRNVEIFAVELCSFEEMRGKCHLSTPKQPLFMVDKVAFPNVEELQLWSLDSMKQIWLGQFHPTSFCNLRVLDVRRCDSLTHLLPSAILKSLVQIKSIIVWDCMIVKEIITSEEGEAMDEITLNQLKSLKLVRLPNLRTICPGSNTLSFPSLEEVLVEKCLKLKSFSTGILNAPKVDKVYIESRWDDPWVWKGDINSTIQHLFAQKDSQNLG